MYKWNFKNPNNPFLMREGEKISNLEKYVELLKKNNIPFSEEQYEEAKKELHKK
jgi:cbb3-type cytochrome oxidase cytochrome c subunit